jgi:NTE family protein
MKKKIGLCFTGGGARGAYQIGAAQALADLGIYENISAFSGSSIGAANVAVMASTSIDKAREIWFNIPEDALEMKEPIVKRIKREKFSTFDNGIYSMETFNRIMIDIIDYDVLQVKDVFVTVSESGDMSKGILELFRSSYKHYIKKDSKVLYVPLKELTKENQIKAVTASCSIPVIFPGVTGQNKKYYDGGVFDNTPVRPLVDLGCNEVIVIGISFFAFELIQSKKHPDVIIHQIKGKKKMGGVLDFSSKHSKEIYKYGYRDTIEYFSKLGYSQKKEI